MTAFFATKGNLEQLLLAWRRQYGDFFEFQVPGSPPVLCVCNPDAIREVFEVLQYGKSPRYLDLLPILGEQSMVITEGHTWRAQRDTFNPGFSQRFLSSALPGFVSCTEHLVDRLAAAAEGEEVALMHHLAVLTTLEVICKVGFGEEVDFLTAGRSGPLWSAFEGLGTHVAYYIDNVPLNPLKNLPWNRAKAQRLQADLDSQLMAILRKRLREMGVDTRQQQQGEQQQQQQRGEPAAAGRCPIPGVGLAAAGAAAAAAPGGAGGECPFADGTAAAAAAEAGPGAADADAAAQRLMLSTTDILSLAVKLGREQPGGSGGGVDLDSLLSNMKTFFAAGHDTTASLVGWTLWFCSQHPRAGERLAAEVAAVMGEDARPSYEQLSRMTYLNAVLKEALRVRPPVGVLARWGPEGTSLSGYDTSNKVLLVSPYVQHMDEAAWGHDASEFRPERWLEEGGAAARVGSYSYLPFSRGPRDCIGARFALLEAKTILAMVLQRFDLEYAGERPEEVMMSVTAHPRWGVPMRVRWRPGQQQRWREQREREREQAEAAAAAAPAVAP